MCTPTWQDCTGTCPGTLLVGVMSPCIWSDLIWPDLPTLVPNPAAVCLQTHREAQEEQPVSPVPHPYAMCCWSNWIQFTPEPPYICHLCAKVHLWHILCHILDPKGWLGAKMAECFVCEWHQWSVVLDLLFNEKTVMLQCFWWSGLLAVECVMCTRRCRGNAKSLARL